MDGRDSLPVAQVIRTLQAYGVRIVDEEDCLRVFPPDDGAPFAEIIDTDRMIRRRLVIQIARKCKISAHFFWHPDYVAESSTANHLPSSDEGRQERWATPGEG